jgi:hypothetical protein
VIRKSRIGFFSFIGRIVPFLLAAVFWLCFFWLIDRYRAYPIQTSSDVASWAQAFGSVVAIGVAIWLAKSSDFQRDKNTFTSCLFFQSQLIVILNYLEQASREENLDLFNRHKLLLPELMEYGRRLSLDGLSSQRMWNFFESLSVAVQADNLVNARDAYYIALSVYSPRLAELSRDAISKFRDFKANR